MLKVMSKKIQSINKSNQIIIKKITTKSITNILDEIKNYTEHNLKHIDFIEFKINNNPSIFSKKYQVKICLKKDEMNIYKYIDNNKINEIKNEINEFLKNEIKV